MQLITRIHNWLRSWQEDREDERDHALGQRIREERAAYRRGEGRDFEIVVAELNRQEKNS